MKPLAKPLLTSLFILLSFLSNGQFTGDSYTSAKSSKKAKLIYLHPGVNGFANEDESGNATGLLVDVMKEFENYLKKTEGIEVSSQFVKIPNRDFKLYLEKVSTATNGVFGLANTTITVDRKKFIQFSDPFMRNVSVLISHLSFQKLNGMEEIASAFASKTAIGVPSTINHDRLLEVKEKYYPDMQIKTVRSSHQILENIAENPDLFGFINAHYYLEYLKQGKPIMRHSVGDEGGREFGIAMPLKSDWEPVLSLFLKNFLVTPKFRELIIKNLGKDALRMI